MIRKLKYLAWKYYLRPYTGWIGTHISAGPRILLTGILDGILLSLYRVFAQNWAIWLIIPVTVWFIFQVWLSFDLGGVGFPALFPITKEETEEFENEFNK